MKRFRIINFDFDSRATILSMEISKDWDENVRLQWEASIKHIEEGIGEQFGALNLQHKIERFKKIGPKPFSIISYHNNLLTDIRNAYVLGSFYSSLTGTCALGERILNHLILDLREYYKPKYNFWKDIWNIIYKNNKFDIYTCKTCSSWALMINTLLGWKVFSEETASLVKRDTNRYTLILIPFKIWRKNLWSLLIYCKKS